ncbi:neurogenic locus notch homolog protein 2-like [Saccostrea cucullata]|uniref:neurogenic locus notch homolog protein 2-like n=1 Tax=Saccostrea cuccullata TaxID=36930 RepID=UPI002ED66EE2
MWQVLIFPAFAGAILIPEGCQNIPLCGQLPWSEWGLCSRTCGGGSQTRKREVCGLQEWNEEDVEDQCGKPPRLEYRVCNTNCFNGGIFADDICICYHGKTGRCCENEITSLEKLVTSKEKASSFLREVGIRSKRDHHIDEECSESGSCDHEEVEEWISYKHDPRDVCTWMKDRRCNERSCGAGYRCITINRDCSRYSHYQVGCTDIDECASNPCNHGGTCHNYQNRFSCTCPDEYYGTRCEYTCRKPVNCLHQKCNTWDDFICTECMNQGSDRKHSIYYVSTDRKKCEATCSWKQNWCWPGTCTQNLAKNCHCSNGFHLSSRDSHKICNLNIAPDLETCRLGVQNIGGEARNSTSTGPCLQEKYNYMKFQPEYSSTVFTFGSTINVSSNVPDHISEYQFGIVNTTISVSTRNINGHQKNQKYLYLKQTNSCSRNNFTDTNPISTIITCKMTIATPWIIQDGEQLCMEFTAYAGGYLKTKDFHGNPSLPHIYRTTQSSYEVCMRRDSAAPKHCLEDNSCTKNEVILFENRITNSADLNISLNGWFDPYRYTPEEASGIQSYSITIHDMKEVDKSTLSMDEGSLLTLNISSEVDSIQLPDKQPALYGVSLNILDNAGNFKQARRFVLFDNSSEIQINAENKLIVYTGNKATNFTWQTNHAYGMGKHMMSPLFREM